MMRYISILLLLSCFSLVFANGAVAESSQADKTVLASQQVVKSPVAILEKLSEEMLSTMKKRHQDIKADPALMRDIIRRILIPHADMERMSQATVGRLAWDGASMEQRKEFVEEFTTMVLRTYSTALAAYKDETIQFLPLRENYLTERRVQVKSLILQAGGPSIPVNYRMLRGQNGNWLVYDLNVDGVSLVQSYRAQFASTLNNGGMSELLKQIASHNEQKKHENNQD